MSNTLIRAKNIYKSYPQGNSELKILKGIDLEINKGDAICVSGASGSGKSTLLHIIGTLDKPTSGDLRFIGKNLLSNNEDELAEFRRKTIGFVFQFHHLLGEFTALENVMMPGRIAGLNKTAARSRAINLLDQVGLVDRAKHYPSELSGGEQQRLAVARALFSRPAILLADEPTGNLDSQNSKAIQDLFFQLHKDLGLTLVVVTHDEKFASRFPIQKHLLDGKWS